jgi:hypothetical protein
LILVVSLPGGSSKRGVQTSSSSSTSSASSVTGSPTDKNNNFNSNSQMNRSMVHEPSRSNGQQGKEEAFEKIANDSKKEL